MLIARQYLYKIAPQRRTQRFALVAFHFPAKMQIFDLHNINPKKFGTQWSDVGGRGRMEGHEKGRILF